MVLPMPSPQKSKSGVYYFRQRVPADLRHKVGKAELLYSLRTKDPAEAKARFAQESAKVALRWKALRAIPGPLPHVQLVALAGELYRRQMALLKAEPGEPEIWVEVLNLLGRLDGDSAALERWYGPTADELLQDHGLASDGASRTRLIQEAHSAYRQAAEQLLKQARGDYRPDPDAGRFPELTAPSTPQRASKGVSIGDLFDLWERDHLADGRSKRTPRDHRQKVDDFIAFLGHEDAAQVTAKDVSDWTENLRHERGLAAKTVSDKYLSALRAVFGAGVAKFRIERNPVAPVRVKVPKRTLERSKGYTDEEAARVLKAALEALDAPGNTSPVNRLVYRWLPWICAYTGARGGEIAQLRKEDFTVEAGINCIRITPEAGSVKSGEYRIVPLHPHLIEQGLLKMVEAAKGGPLFYAESKRQRNAGSSRAGYARGKASEWVRKTVKITDKRVQPNHGWRHRFKTTARDVGIEQRYMDAIQGHTDGSASASYGENTVRALYREIQKLPRYDLGKK
ncbi:MAG: integrase [Mesorhizobium sp.]|nr:MAG: integrase [Mesorhizobium sp.]TJV55703.1 MAG: integrase [Mesorhizobium sp.]